jgi:phosphate transport system substrate-binding protein
VIRKDEDGEDIMKRLTIIMAVLLVAGLCTTGFPGERVLNVNTGGTLLGGKDIQAANEAFEKKTGIRVKATKGPKGQCGFTVKNLEKGKIDMGVMCCPPNRVEVGRKGLVQTPVALGAWVFVVNKSNPVQSLSTQQIRDIYQGRVTNWKEVGGTNASIQPRAYIMCASREDALRQFLAGERQYKKGIVGIDNSRFAPHVKKVTPGDPENCALAETDPNVIVGVPYHNVAGSKPECSAMRRGAVKVIAVDDVMPNPKNIRSEAYPVTNYLFMITKGVPDNEEARYLRFLTSDDGQRILAAGGMAVALP